ncbi:BatA and WFA domain-containing protein [Oscillatoria laete-virens NRMC-F 0139]|nr:BatA and WFA domain-containing protein [Oscillatoria laete-virens]MDL5052805.1 BatA and WFA domain-containing protein [Oscillatoria laete-virens NRMC-F 0139]
MNLIFSNLAGFWALLAIPVILVIHFFQQKSRTRKISTLFLLRHLTPESAQGRAFERLRASWPLFLQILCVLLVTWLLVGPRWLRPATSQRVVMVMDASLSMQAFRPELQSALSEFFSQVQKTAVHQDIHIISTDLSRPTIHRGNDPRQALEQIAQWTPTRGSHDVEPALRLARTLADDQSMIVFVSDRTRELPGGIEQIAVGETLDNAGFLGATIHERDGQTLWKAVVRNYSDKPLTRQWWIETADGARSSPESLSLGAGQFTVLGGVFPEGQERFTVRLTGDRFAIDDSLPFVRPVAKRMKIWIAPGSKLQPFLQRLGQSFEGAEFTTVESEADLKLVAMRNPAAPLPEGEAIVFLEEWSENPPYLKGAVVEENHPLLRDLGFQGLLAQGASPGFPPPASTDDVLVWLGARPLIFLRTEPAGEKLFINFDPALSNAARLPSFILLLDRMAARVRSRVIGAEVVNADAGQTLAVTFDPRAGQLRGEGIRVDLPAVWSEAMESHRPSFTTTVRAPYFPGYATVAQGGSNLLTVASQFSDTRVADFSTAARADSTPGRMGELRERSSREDFLTPLWIMLILAALLTSWRLTSLPPGAPKPAKS